MCRLGTILPPVPASMTMATSFPASVSPCNDVEKEPAPDTQLLLHHKASQARDDGHLRIVSLPCPYQGMSHAERNVTVSQAPNKTLQGGQKYLRWDQNQERMQNIPASFSECVLAPCGHMVCDLATA